LLKDTETELINTANNILTNILKESNNKKRVISAYHDNNNYWTLSIDSSHLSLEKKIIIEKKLTQIDNYNTKHLQEISIHFKRLQQQKTPPSISIDSNNKNSDKAKIKNIKNILAVYSGKGGVGKSTTSLLIAYALNKKGYKTALLDADIYGPSCHRLLGLDRDSLQIINKKLIPAKIYNLQCLSFGMLTHDYQATQWRGPLLTKAIQQLCFQSEWEEADWLIIDMPPGTGDIQMSIFDSLAINGVVAVTTPQDLALLDVKKSLSLIAKYDLNLYGILENMSFHQCKECKHISFPFGQIDPQTIIRDYGYKHLGAIPLDQSLSKNDSPLSPESIPQKIISTLDTTISNLIEN
jgi:ATP-binding protein involved in chromosome partitioning